MGIIEYHEGCNVKHEGCFGPWDNFYTVFGTELGFLTGHIIVSIIIGIALFAVLFFLNKKGRLTLPLYLIILIPIVVATLLFFVFAYFFPVKVIY